MKKFLGFVFFVGDVINGVGFQVFSGNKAKIRLFLDFD